MERRKESMDSVGNFVFIKGDLSKNKNGDPVTSKSNAMLAVVLPDENGSYSYYLEKSNAVRMAVQCIVQISCFL